MVLDLLKHSCSQRNMTGIWESKQEETCCSLVDFSSIIMGPAAFLFFFSLSKGWDMGCCVWLEFLQSHLFWTKATKESLQKTAPTTKSPTIFLFRKNKFVILNEEWVKTTCCSSLLVVPTLQPLKKKQTEAGCQRVKLQLLICLRMHFHCVYMHY